MARVRRCVRSQEAERAFFEPYVEGNMDDFLAYVAAKRQNAVWGDDPEVQALCELYDRPAEIWAYEAQHGARKLRTFHENCGESRQRPPMRLSYYGGGHYDSVVSLAEPVPSAPRPVAGELEDAAIKRAELRKRMAGGIELSTRLSDEEATEQAEVEMALKASREGFDAQFEDLEATLKASLDNFDKEEDERITRQIEEDDLKTAEQKSDLETVQEQMYRDAALQSEDDVLRKAVEASLASNGVEADADRDLISAALQESINDDEMQAALKASLSIGRDPPPHSPAPPTAALCVCRPRSA